METLIYKLIQIVGISWFITNFEPLQIVIEGLQPVNKGFNKWIYAIFLKLITCSTCFSFWFGLYYLNWNIANASVSSLLTFIVTSNLKIKI